MQKIKDNKRIYLSGGGNEHQSFPLDKFFFDALPKNARFLYIPIALRDHELYPTAHLWIKGVAELHNRSDIEIETADDLSQYKFENLTLFDVVYIGGGNTWNLVQEVKDSGFSEVLIKYVKAGGLVYGGSAGAIILGKKIDTHDDENKIGSNDVYGLDLLSSFSIACHYKDEQSPRFEKWVMDNKLNLLCLYEETGISTENSTAHCIGAKSCVIYFADGTKREVNSGESFEL